MSKARKRFSADFKAKVAVEAIKENLTINEMASQFEVHANQITTWKKQALEGLSEVFSLKKFRSKKEGAEREAALYQEVGKLKMEIEWLKKKSGILKS